MLNHDQHTIQSGSNIRVALEKLNGVPKTLSLFVLNEYRELVGTLTDGDVRRGLISGISLDATVDAFMFKKHHALKGLPNPREVTRLRKLGIKLIPMLDDKGRISKIIDLNQVRTCLPVDAVLMAGGRGERLRPLTDSVPKPMLPLGSKPIIEHNIDHLAGFGISNINISINYLGQQLVDYFGDGSSRNLNLRYVREDQPLGTIGSVSLVEHFESPYILVMNSDLFTNVDIEDMWLNMDEQQADLCVASIPYTVSIPFAILERHQGFIVGLKEKPTNTHYANAGIYLFRREIVDLIPRNKLFNATDLIERVIKEGGKVIDTPITGYWIDIGRHEEYEKAKMIVHHVQR